MKPTVSLCMIVNDEEEYLPNALASVKDLVDEIIVVDTGSKDRSVDIAKQNGAYVHPYMWKSDFSAAKNYAIRQASGDWILFMDADQELDNMSKDKIARLIVDSTIEGYYVKRKNYLDGGDVIVDRQMVLFKNRPIYRFKGVWGERVFPLEQHEQAVGEADEVIIHHYGFLQFQMTKKNKLQRNMDVIRKYREENENDPCSSYWLGLQFFREEWFQEASEVLESALTSIKLPIYYYSHAIYLLGQCYLKTLQVDKGKALLDQAIEIFPDYPDLYYIRAVSDMYEEKWDQAADFLLQCCILPSPSLNYIFEEDLSTSYCYSAAAICFQQMGQTEKIVEFLNYVKKNKFQ